MSQSNARPCNVEWIRDIVKQCKAAGVKVFVKQLGAKPYTSPSLYTGPNDLYTLGHGDGGRVEHKLKDPKGGDMEEWPDEIRIREMPIPQPI